MCDTGRAGRGPVQLSRLQPRGISCSAAILQHVCPEDPFPQLLESPAVTHGGLVEKFVNHSSLSALTIGACILCRPAVIRSPQFAGAHRCIDWLAGLYMPRLGKPNWAGQANGGRRATSTDTHAASRGLAAGCTFCFGKQDTCNRAFPSFVPQAALHIPLRHSHNVQ